MRPAGAGLLAALLSAGLGASTARAEEPDDALSAVAHDREIGARLGLTTGGGLTAGGVRIGGVYLYQLSASDWFEGNLAFTFGGGDPACFRDRQDVFVCRQDSLDGNALDAVGGVRRFFAPNDRFTPYARVQVGLRVVRFSADDVNGLAIPVVAGAGVRARLSPLLTVGIDAALEAGVGVFGSELGAATQLGLATTGTVEFRLE